MLSRVQFHCVNLLVLSMGQFSTLVILIDKVTCMQYVLTNGNFSYFREADTTKERIEKLLKAGANVVLTTKGIDDMALKVYCFITF